eukprot:scaffold4195_cov250-Pinguiococcus_pyrenoidosus.AAC.8
MVISSTCELPERSENHGTYVSKRAYRSGLPEVKAIGQQQNAALDIDTSNEEAFVLEAVDVDLHRALFDALWFSGHCAAAAPLRTPPITRLSYVHS